MWQMSKSFYRVAMGGVIAGRWWKGGMNRFIQPFIQKGGTYHCWAYPWDRYSPIVLSGCDLTRPTASWDRNMSLVPHVCAGDYAGRSWRRGSRPSTLGFRIRSSLTTRKDRLRQEYHIPHLLNIVISPEQVVTFWFLGLYFLHSHDFFP